MIHRPSTSRFPLRGESHIWRSALVAPPFPTSPSDSRRTHLTRLRTRSHSFKMPSRHGPGPANPTRSLSPWSSASIAHGPYVFPLPSRLSFVAFLRGSLYRYSYSARTNCMTVSLRLFYRDDLFPFRDFPAVCLSWGAVNPLYLNRSCLSEMTGPANLCPSNLLRDTNTIGRRRSQDCSWFTRMHAVGLPRREEGVPLLLGRKARWHGFGYGGE